MTSFDVNTILNRQSVHGIQSGIDTTTNSISIRDTWRPNIDNNDVTDRNTICVAIHFMYVSFIDFPT